MTIQGRGVAMFVKRFLDITASLVLLFLTSPIIVFFALLIRIKMGSPILFKQERPGLGMKPFHIYKFRTMTNEHNRNGDLLSDQLRLTSFGALLRKYSIDELPQLFNVLKGDMSLVGPRPLLMRYLPYFKEKEKKRFLVRPGITGLAQLAGRTHLAWDERLGKDCEYVENWSIMLDMEIMLRTIVSVYRKDGYVEVNEGRLPDLDTERSSTI
jgi:lipopolysaccharide/colanic/teichoic acid biosynthesis glycosyltransferase